MDRQSRAAAPIYIRRGGPAHADRHLPEHRHPGDRRRVAIHRPESRRNGRADHHPVRASPHHDRGQHRAHRAFEAALRLTTNRYEGGAAPRSDVAQAQTQLETTRTQAIDVAVQRAQFEHAIATLIGRPPAAFGVAPRPLNTCRRTSRPGSRRSFSSGDRTSPPQSGEWPGPTSKSGSRRPRTIRRSC